MPESLVTRRIYLKDYVMAHSTMISDNILSLRDKSIDTDTSQPFTATGFPIIYWFTGELYSYLPSNSEINAITLNINGYQQPNVNVYLSKVEVGPYELVSPYYFSPRLTKSPNWTLPSNFQQTNPEVIVIDQLGMDNGDPYAYSNLGMKLELRKDDGVAGNIYLTYVSVDITYTTRPRSTEKLLHKVILP